MDSNSSRAVHVLAYRFSRRGCFSSAKAPEGDEGYSLSWDSKGVTLATAATEPVPVATVPWQQVTGVWVSMRSSASSGFHLDITLETSHVLCEFDFLYFRAALGGPGGEFLSYLQSSQVGRIKDGHAPAFATSRWASWLLGSGVSVRNLRLGLGRAGIILEVLYAMCFLAQLQHVLLSKEAKLSQAFSDLFQDLYDFGGEQLTMLPLTFADFSMLDFIYICCLGVPGIVLKSSWKVVHHTSSWLLLMMLLQHLFTLFFMLDGVWRTIRAAIKSLMTFHKAAARVNKAVKKAKTKEVLKEPTQEPPTSQDARSRS